MLDNTTSSRHGVKTKNDGSTSGNDEALVEVWTQELTDVDIMILDIFNKADVRLAILKNQKEI